VETILSRGGHVAAWSWRREGDEIRVEGPDGESVGFRVLAQDGPRLLVEFGGRRTLLHHARDRNRIHLQGHGWWRSFEIVEEGGGEDFGMDDKAPVVRAPMPGKVLEILVAVGDEVREGQEVLRVEAMKMEVGLNAPFDGTVVEVSAEVGTIVDPEQALMVFRPADAE
jgi:acetyl/propionyl-CoA carboxylase alpha subunit